jgi:uncharacterized membrane protein YedE/YeeE
LTEFTPLSAIAGGLLIGLAAALLMVTTGRIAGVSAFLSRLMPPYTDDQAFVRLAFIAGLICAPWLYAAYTGEVAAITVTSNASLLVAAGLLVGFGAVWGSGCTSGHGVCGIARLSPRSLSATAVFMAAAFATVFASRHLMGG